MVEYWDLYDKNGNKQAGKVSRGEDIPEGMYHLSVEVWFVNSNNEILLQKRSANKKILPNMWAESAGGAVLSGESEAEAVLRETKEELGIFIDISKMKKIHQTVRHGNTLVHIYMSRQDIDIENIKIDEEEVSEVKWVSIADIKKLALQDNFAFVIMDGLKYVIDEMKTRSHFGVYALIEKGNQILVIKKNRGPYMGLYDLPGGSLDENEEYIQALVREVKEETGCDILDREFMMKFQVEFTCFMEENGIRGCLAHTGILYRCKIAGEPDEAIFDQDSAGALWIKKDDLSEKNASPIVLVALEK